MNRPAVAGEQVRGWNGLRSWSPCDKGVVQDDQAAAGRERLKQLVVAFAPRSRLNLSVGCFDFILGQVAHSEMKQVPLKPQRQFFADGDTAVQIGTRAPQSDV